jgi:hypothetical protein
MGRDVPATRILVKSGKPWPEQVETLTAEECPPHHVVEDLMDATELILG